MRGSICSKTSPPGYGNTLRKIKQELAMVSRGQLFVLECVLYLFICMIFLYFNLDLESQIYGLMLSRSKTDCVYSQNQLYYLLGI